MDSAFGTVLLEQSGGRDTDYIWRPLDTGVDVASGAWYPADFLNQSNYRALNTSHECRQSCTNRPVDRVETILVGVSQARDRTIPLEISGGQCQVSSRHSYAR